MPRPTLPPQAAAQAQASTRRGPPTLPPQAAAQARQRVGYAKGGKVNADGFRDTTKMKPCK